MWKTILICFLCSVMFFQSCDTSYKIIKSKDIGEFIVPPDTYWGFKENGEKKYGYDRYYYILFCGLSDKYVNSVSALNKTISWSGDDDYFIKECSQLKRKAKEKDEKVEFSNLSSYTLTSELFKCAPINNQKSGYLIQIDCDSLIITENEKQTSENFKKLAKDLLIKISEKETEYRWPTSISQNIVEKVFEHIPVPQEASLARYGWEVTKEYSMLLLNPKISLDVEISSLSWSNFPKPPGEHWYYTLVTKTNINFYRDESGKIYQLPFVQFSNNTMPSNSFIGKDPNQQMDPTTILLNNSGDLQLSENSKNKHFVVLFQDYMKQNSNYSNRGTDDSRKGDQKDRYSGNSILLLNDNLDLLLKGANEKTNVKAAYNSQGYNYKNDSDDYEDKDYDKYSRTLITPVIIIYYNNFPVTIKLGSNTSILNQQYNFGNQFSIYRSFNGKYIKIKKSSDSNIVFLPGDKIIY